MVVVWSTGSAQRPRGRAADGGGSIQARTSRELQESALVMKGVQLDAAVCPGTVQSPDCRARGLHGRNARVKSYESNAPERSSRDTNWKPPCPGNSCTYTAFMLSSDSAKGGAVTQVFCRSPETQASILLCEEMRVRLRLVQGELCSEYAYSDA